MRNYLKQIIEGTIILHENNRVHGQINPIQIGCSMGICKIRISLTSQNYEFSNFLKDIHQIAMVGYEMAYGLKNTYWEQERGYSHYETSEYRHDILSQLINKSQGSKEYIQLDDLLRTLLEQQDNYRITASGILTHPFF